MNDESENFKLDRFGENDIFNLFTQFYNESAMQSKLNDLSNSVNSRLNLDIQQMEILTRFKILSNQLTYRPLTTIPVGEDALLQWMKANKPEKIDEMSVNLDKPRFFLNVEGPLGQNSITPRGLCARVLHQLVRVTGIVTKATIVRPRVEVSQHWCESTRTGHVREYPDQMRISQCSGTGTTAFPTKDNQGNPLSCEQGLCQYTDFQTIVLQELPEGAPPGALPRSCTVILTRDLVDKAGPGNRVEVTGVWKAVGGVQMAAKGGQFRGIILATGVIQLGDTSPSITTEDVASIKREAENIDIVSKLAASLAPSLAGHNMVKKGLILQLLGGVTKTLQSGTRLRGDINVLLTGDPGCAKSQLLRNMMRVAPLAVCTTGRGSSGVGLTAAVVSNNDTKEKMLEAGAMVLADGGVVCIDEFDKMEEEDRVALHEAMEQQTVTVAKAGIHVTLNARCSVLAASNPIQGTWQRDIPLRKNLALPDSLLSRFDLVFVCLDTRSIEKDETVSRRVLLNHCCQTENNEAMTNFGELYDKHRSWIVPFKKGDLGTTSEVFERSYGEREVYTKDFLKKYLAFAKKLNDPVLQDSTCSYITGIYAAYREDELKPQHRNKCLPVTVRSLETIIRLSTAHAKARLSREVEMEDVQAILELMDESVFCRALNRANVEEEYDEDLDDVDTRLKELVMRETMGRDTTRSTFSPLVSEKRVSRTQEKEMTSTSHVKSKQAKTKKKPKKDELGEELREVQSMFQQSVENETKLRDMKKKTLELVGDMWDSGRYGDSLEPSDVLAMVRDRAAKITAYECLAPVTDLPALFTVLRELETDNRLFITSSDKIMLID